MEEVARSAGRVKQLERWWCPKSVPVRKEALAQSFDHAPEL